MALQIRRGTDAERQTITPKVGEPIYTTDQKELYIGDGTTQGGIQISGTLVNEETPRLGANLDLNNNDITGTGSINIDGTITATGNINLGDAVDDNIIVGGQIGSSLIPNAGSTFDLGAEGTTWSNVYADTFNGNLIGTVDGDLSGSVFADDSTLLVDGIARKFFGNIAGNIEDNSGNIIYDNTTKAFTVGNITIEAGGSISGDRLLVGTDDSFFFTQQAPSVQTSFFTIGQYHDEQDSHNFAFTRARGNLFTPESVQDGDVNIDIAIAPLFDGEYKSGGAISSSSNITGGIITTEWGIAILDSTGNTPVIARFTENGLLTDTIASDTNESVEFTNAPKLPVYADASARDSAITTPAAGMIVLVGTEFQGYNGSAWVALS